MVRQFRADIYKRVGFVEFPPQAAFRLASEGWELTNKVVEAPEWEEPPYDPKITDPAHYLIKPKPVRLLVPCLPEDPDAQRIAETDNFAKEEWRLAVPREFSYLDRQGIPVVNAGVIAHKVSLLASFKMGKSRNIGMWASGFACLPGATIEMVGLEYATSQHEFEYLCETLLSGTNPIIKKWKHRYNDVRAGRMYLELLNGCSFSVKSWQNKDLMRGAQLTTYIFNEVYQLPGLEAYTGHAQNLRVEKGFAVFTSTPDKPWVKVLHTMGHGHNPDWHCVCDNNAFVNPFSFDLTGLMADLPDWATLREFAPGLMAMAEASGLQPGALMSKEKFMISWLGRVGGFVGRVYSFSREAITCNPGTHPKIWKPSVVTAWEDRQAYLQEVREAVH